MVQWRHIRKSVYPKDLPEVLKSIPGFHPDDLRLDWREANELTGMRYETMCPEDQEKWALRVLRRDNQWFNIFRYILKTQNPDFGAVVFDGVDKLQHLCWRFIDPSCMPSTWMDWERKMRDHTLDYFRNVDDYIRNIVNLAGEDSNVLIVSDHGFGPTRYIFHVNMLLEKLGCLNWKKETDEDVLRFSHEWSFASVDWTKTCAYAGTPSSNGVFIRAPGRPGENRISQRENIAVRERLIRELREFRDPASGEQIVTEIRTREDAFSGPAMDKAPDLLLTLSDYSFVSIVKREPIVFERPNVAGTHRPDGILIARGPMFRRGEVSEECSILDVPPTLLYCLGMGIPEDFEGKLLKEAIRPEVLRANPVVVRAGAKAAGLSTHSGEPESPYTEDEEEEIMSQLRALGYVE
jgi:predicted AlkP superfamily phosphohydrolase/phosphomutase